MFHDSDQVTTVPEEDILAVGTLLLHVAHTVVAAITIGEAVGHDQVDEILRGNSLCLNCIAIALLELIRVSLSYGPTFIQKLNLKGSRCGSQANVYQNKKVVGVFQARNTLDAYPRIINANVVLTDILIVDENFQFSLCHARPPKQGFCPCLGEVLPRRITIIVDGLFYPFGKLRVPFTFLGVEAGKSE